MGIAQVAQVEHVAEQLVAQLRVEHGGHGQVGVARRHVRAQPRRELADVRRHLHYQHASVGGQVWRCVRLRSTSRAML